MVPDYLFKVAKKKQNFGKVARSCSSAKKLLRGQKVAKKLPSTIWLCLAESARFRNRYPNRYRRIKSNNIMIAGIPFVLAGQLKTNTPHYIHFF